MKNYNIEDVIKAIECSVSIADVLRLIGLKAKGGNYQTIKKIINDYGINVDHFSGKGHKKNLGVNKKIPLELLLINNIDYKSSDLKKRLFDEGLKNKICEKCEKNNWLGEPIPLELHHINGNRYDNRLFNLQILCPNCHALTDNFRGKNLSKRDINVKTVSELYSEYLVGYNLDLNEKKLKINYEKKNNLCECGEKISRRAKQCVSCYNKKLDNQRKNRPDKETLLNDVKELGYKGTGLKYGVSDNAIRKWLK